MIFLSNEYENLKSEQTQIWKLQSFLLILEYQFKMVIPSPFRFIYNIYALIWNERKIDFGKFCFYGSSCIFHFIL